MIRSLPLALWVGAAALSGCARSDAQAPDRLVPEGPARVLLVSDASQPGPVLVAEQAARALADAHVAFDRADVSEPFRPLGYDAVLLTAERLDDLAPETARGLHTLVQRGGGVGVLFRGWGEAVAPLLGLPTAPPAFAEIEAGTYRTERALMPAEDGLELPVEGETMYDVPDPAGCDVIGRIGPRPAAWTCARGAGRIAYWNGTRFGDKHFRGHILQTLALVSPDLVRPLANWAVVYIDDFPSPAPIERLDPIASEFGTSVVEFYAHRWYPDMRRLADEHGIVYTSTVTFAYNGRTEAPFGFAEWLAATIEDGGREVPYAPWIAHEDLAHSELALHGYNHQSLTLDLWPDGETMEQALRAARGRWAADHLGDLPTTYVPPMNWIDSVGTRALHNAMPEVRSVAGLFWGDAAEGQDQEFGPDRWVPELYAFPRTTSGFDLHPIARLEMLAGLYTVGGWGHFVHPDEILPNADREETYAAAGLPSPSSLGWYGDDRGGLFYQFSDWLDVVRDAFPWLEYVRADEGLRRQKAYDALRLAATTERAASGRTTTVLASRPGHDLLIAARPGERLSRADGGEVLDTWEGPLLTQYIVRQRASELRLHFQTAAL